MQEGHRCREDRRGKDREVDFEKVFGVGLFGLKSWERKWKERGKETGQQPASKEHGSRTERASEGEKIEKKWGRMRGVSVCLLEV